MMASLKGTKLKKKMILQTYGEKINTNNYPCKGFHLNIFQRDNDPGRVDFIYLTPEEYKTTASQLKTEDDVKAFFEILKKENKEIRCEENLFVFKTIYSNLNETELEILRNSRKKPDIIKKNNDEKYFKFLDKFLKLKAGYEKKIREYKKNIIQNNLLSFEEKKKRIKKYKYKCLGCKRNVGTNFNNKNGKISITCGDVKEPCKLNTSATRPTYLYIPDEIEKILTLLEETKQQIIKVKLNLLFKLKPEEIVTEEFETFKRKYNDLNAKLISYQLILEEKQGNESRKENFEVENLKLYTYINLFDQNIKEYQISNKKTFLKEAIEIYLKDILPIQENIRNILYEIKFIEKIAIGSENDILCKLIQKKNTIESNQYKIPKT